jgi:hypothetical protein
MSARWRPSRSSFTRRVLIGGAAKIPSKKSSATSPWHLPTQSSDHHDLVNGCSYDTVVHWRGHGKISSAHHLVETTGYTTLVVQ